MTLAAELFSSMLQLDYKCCTYIAYLFIYIYSMSMVVAYKYVLPVHTLVCERAGVWSRLLHHCFTGRVQLLGVRPYCTRTKVMKRLQVSLRFSSGPSGEEKTSIH